MLIVLVVAQGIGTAFFEPARIASVPQIVGEKHIPQAVALFQATASAIHLAAPAAAGLLLAFSSMSTIFLLDAASYLVSAGFLFSLTSLDTKREKGEKQPYWQSLTGGLRDIAGNPLLRGLLLLLMPLMVAGGMFMTSLKALLIQTLQVPAIHYGLLEGISGAGAIVGAMVGPLVLKNWGADRLMMAAAGILGAVMLASTLLDRLHMHWGISAIYGWCLLAGLFQGFQATITLWMISGVLLGGWVAQESGVLSSMIAAGSILVGTVVLYAFIRKKPLLVQERV
jgi:DHA3 family macrolide efflux protein-like MFS transporter